MILPSDEELHPIGPEKHWQESYYFNWADPDGKEFGLTRIGYRFSEKQIDALVLTMRDGEPEFMYPGVNLPHKGKWNFKAGAGLRGGRLSYKMIEPLSKWELVLSGKNALQLEWTSLNGAFDYRGEERELPENVAGYHLEQMGRVEGWIRVRGRERQFRGFGERDKSWGVRDWANVEGWNWVSAQFGEGLAFNLWEGFFSRKRYLNGYVFRDGENAALASASVRFEWAGRKHLIREALFEMTDVHGKKFRVRAQPLARVPLVKKGLWLEEVHCRFLLEGGSSATPGIGIIEHAWHAGMLGTLRQGGDLVRAGAKLLRP
ncbi:MAG: hypothetical protein AB1405_03950 [Bdellovibrionota bacterium]